MKQQQRQTAKSNHSRGIALITVLLLLLILSAAAVALMYTVNTEVHLQKTDQGTGMAYYGAEAGMEKMMTDLSNLYNVTPFPSATAIQNVAGLTNVPPAADLNGTGFSQYQIVVPTDVNGNPNFYSTTVHGGANDGLLAQVLQLKLQTTAVRPGQGEQASMERKVEVALIPVFQFGIFSNTDVDFFAGPDFVFGGRVHTNGNLFLAEGGNLTFLDKVHASFDIVRDTLANGVNIAGNHTGAVYIPTTPSGCPVAGATSSSASCRALGWQSPDEGSSVNGTLRPPGIPTAGGTSNAAIFGPLSTTTYTQGFLQANVPPLNLPFVSSGVDPVEIIRQPQPTDNQALTTSRLYNKAQIWVLLADTQAELPGNGTPLTPGTGAGDPENIRLSTFAGYPVGTVLAIPQVGQQGDQSQTKPNAATPLAVDGWIRVMYSKGPGTTPVAVTDQWLGRGISRQQAFPDSEAGVGNTVPNNSGAILLFQQKDDSPSTAFIPINLYDPREGQPRDDNTGTCNIGGVLNVVDIDVLQLKNWIASLTGGNAVDAVTQNGYGLYFSDRRGMIVNPKTGTKNGDYGFTDVINESSTTGAPNGTLDQGEIPNVDGISVEVFGGANLGIGVNNGTALANPMTTVNCTNARKSWVSGARHAVRLINGSGTNLPSRTNPDPTNVGGFTLASENPVYVRGNYNATTALGFGGNHASAAVIADTVTLLSPSWSDKNSFLNPTAPGSRAATTSFFRLAIASGKNKNFSNAATQGTKSTDYGTDGGMHNFLRLLEGWNGIDLNYRGSMVSLYYSHYATGVFKCCTIVYDAPHRLFNYDTDFQTMNKMPPLTPTFEQVVNIGYSQSFAHQ